MANVLICSWSTNFSSFVGTGISFTIPGSMITDNRIFSRNFIVNDSLWWNTARKQSVFRHTLIKIQCLNDPYFSTREVFLSFVPEVMTLYQAGFEKAIYTNNILKLPDYVEEPYSPFLKPALSYLHEHLFPHQPVHYSKFSNSVTMCKI